MLLKLIKTFFSRNLGREDVLKREDLLSLKNFHFLEKIENQSTSILKSSKISAKKMTCDWQGVKMPHALSISLGCVSYGKYGGRIREAQGGGLWKEGEMMHKALN